MVLSPIPRWHERLVSGFVVAAMMLASLLFPRLAGLMPAHANGNDPCMPDTADLLAYWKLDEGSGTDAADSTGNGHDGTLVNGTSWTPSVAPTAFANDAAASFDGVDDEITAPDTLLGLGTDEFTVTTWAKSTVGDRSVLGHFDNLGGGFRGWGLYFYTTNRVNFFGYGDMGQNDTSYAAIILDGAWHHVAGVYTRSGNSLTITVYVDGVLVGSNTTTVGDMDIATSMRLGHYTFQPTYGGDLDDVRVYDRALSAAEVGSLAGGSCGVFCNGQVPTIVGTAGNDNLTGTPGNDVIHALGGHDIVNGLGGDDTICLGTGNDIGYGGLGHDWIGAGADNDIAYGNAGNDTLLGGTGNDILFGQAGMDSLSGEDGNDNLIGGTDLDTIDGGAGSDVCSAPPDTISNCP